MAAYNLYLKRGRRDDLVNVREMALWRSLHVIDCVVRLNILSGCEAGEVGMQLNLRW